MTVSDSPLPRPQERGGGAVWSQGDLNIASSTFNNSWSGAVRTRTHPVPGVE